VVSIDQRVSGRSDNNILQIAGWASLCISEICFWCLCPDAWFRFGFARPYLLIISRFSNSLNLRHRFGGIGVLRARNAI
jgi:hypothetical protein